MAGLFSSLANSSRDSASGGHRGVTAADDLAPHPPLQIFIDEIDSLFRSRSNNDDEVTGMMKAEFMTWVWIGKR